jgi:hypothetical protein
LYEGEEEGNDAQRLYMDGWMNIAIQVMIDDSIQKDG